MKPPYFKQERSSTCTLAVLRMVLAHFGQDISEDMLRDRVAKNYGPYFKNIWNPTIAKMACENGLDITMYADWLLFKKVSPGNAHSDFSKHGYKKPISSFENQADNEKGAEPLSLAYKEMFKALEHGVQASYGKLTKKIIRSEIAKGKLILSTIILSKLYPDKDVAGHHGILIYGVRENNALYHDPTHGAEMSVSFDDLAKAQDRVAAGIVFEKRK